MTPRPDGAASGRSPVGLVACGAVIAGAFWTIAWAGARPADAIFLWALAVAAPAYVWAAWLLTSGRPPRARVVGACLVLALAWRLPMTTLPDDSAHDAVRYIWDARVVGAGLDPYSARPDDPSLQVLHTSVTRGVDAAWLPTIYPPAAQIYGLAVAFAAESLAAFRGAALLSDAGVVGVLALILRATGRPPAWTLLYAWHPLGPIEGASGAHLDFFGVLLLLLSWLALLRGRGLAAAAAFAASVLVKPLPIVLAPLYWRRVGLRDAALAAAGGAALTLWIARGNLPIGSTGTFIETFRFNGPVFELLDGALTSRGLATLAVLAGLACAAYMRRTRGAGAPEAWAWPLAVALTLSPVIYPWYLVWLLLAWSRHTIPVWIWTISVLAVYPVWRLHQLGGPFAVPSSLLWVEFTAPALAAAILAGLTAPSPLRRHGRS